MPKIPGKEIRIPFKPPIFPELVLNLGYNHNAWIVGSGAQFFAKGVGILESDEMEEISLLK